MALGLPDDSRFSMLELLERLVKSLSFWLNFGIEDASNCICILEISLDICFDRPNSVLEFE